MTGLRRVSMPIYQVALFGQEELPYSIVVHLFICLLELITSTYKIPTVV